jgi:hypothetical protein
MSGGRLVIGLPVNLSWLMLGVCCSNGCPLHLALFLGVCSVGGHKSLRVGGWVGAVRHCMGMG